LVREFYRQPFAWLLLVITDVTLVYGGGAAMFWYHSYFLGEGGPGISPYLHWFIDSTVGLVGLTPAAVVILPIAARAAWDAAPTRRAGRGDALEGPAGGPRDGTVDTDSATPVARTVRPVTFMAVAGILFAMVTAPGPIVHDNLVGRGTWLAGQITKLWGDGRPLSPNHHYPVITSVLTQEAFGLPLYPALIGLLLTVGGFLMKAANRKAVDEPVLVPVEESVLVPAEEPEPS